METRCQPFGGEAGRRADHQDLAVEGVEQALDGLADLQECGVEAGIEHLAGRRQRDRAGVAVEQPLAEEGFEARDLVAQRRRRHVEFVGGARKAFVAGGGLEGAQSVQRGQEFGHLT